MQVFIIAILLSAALRCSSIPSSRMAHSDGVPVFGVAPEGLLPSMMDGDDGQMSDDDIPLISLTSDMDLPLSTMEFNDDPSDSFPDAMLAPPGDDWVLVGPIPESVDEEEVDDEIVEGPPPLLDDVEDDVDLSQSIPETVAHSPVAAPVAYSSAPPVNPSYILPPGYPPAWPQYYLAVPPSYGGYSPYGGWPAPPPVAYQPSVPQVDAMNPPTDEAAPISTEEAEVAEGEFTEEEPSEIAEEVPVEDELDSPPVGPPEAAVPSSSSSARGRPKKGSLKKRIKKLLKNLKKRFKKGKKNFKKGRGGGGGGSGRRGGRRGSASDSSGSDEMVPPPPPPE